MNWRLASRLSVVTLGILVVILVTIVGAKTIGNNTSAQSALQGTDLGGTAAPDFHLTDQSGTPVSLSQFKGKPVVLTFLYTHCPDVCPLTAERLHATMQHLGSDAHNVAVLAVSIDPKGDTPASAIAFSNTHKMQGYWHYLLGTQAQLSPVWSSYQVYSAPTTQGTQGTATGSVSHTSAVFVIDKQGHERVFFGDDMTPDTLAADLQILLKE